MLCIPHLLSPLICWWTLRFFPSLIVVNYNAAVNMGVNIYLQDSNLISFGCINPKVGLLDDSVLSVVSDSLRPHGLQHARLPCLSPIPEACSNSYPSSRWCHPTISPSVMPFSSCLQSFPASRSFPVNRLFPSGGQSVGVSASALVLAMNIQNWISLGLTVLIS